MRILIGTVDVCGWISVLAGELRQQGHSVTTISDANRYFPDRTHDISNEHFVEDYVRFRAKSDALYRAVYAPTYRILSKSGLIPKRRLDNYFRKKANTYFFTHTDLFIYFWNGLTTDDSDIAEFKMHGVKVITWFVGDDVRYYPEMQKQFGIREPFYEGYFKKTFTGLVNKLRIHEKYADVIYSVPDQASLALRPYFHLQIPVQLSKLSFRHNRNEIPVIVHIPSSPQIKGTAIVREAIAALKEEGLHFVYKELINIPNSEVLQELSKADILVDELFLHGPGVLSFEAMGSGCAVATRYLEDSPECFRPPVVPITGDTIREKLSELITNTALRDELIQKGKQYIAMHNSAERIVREMLQHLEPGDSNYDYVPGHFRNVFIPNDSDVALINERTAFVAGEAWYNTFVAKGTRHQLKF